jgi:hypothetical protein
MEALVDVNKLEEQYIPWIKPLNPGENARYVYLGNEGLRSADGNGGKPIVKPYQGLSHQHQIINPQTKKPYFIQYIEKWELKDNGDYKPVTNHIGITNGSLVVNYKQQNLFKFLEASDENESNPYADPSVIKKFRRVDSKKAAMAEIEKDNILEKAKTIAKTADFAKISEIAKAYKMNPEGYDEVELRHDLLTRATRNPTEFLEKSKSEKEANIEDMVSRLISKSIIKYSNSEWTYKDGGKDETICKAIPGEDKTETLIKYLKSRSGKTAIGILETLVN